MAGGIIGGIIGSVLPGVLPTVTETAKILVDRLVPDPTAREQAQREIELAISQREIAITEALSKQSEAQSAINLAEAQGNDRFSSRWRPAAAWVCVGGLAYQFLLAPMLTWFGAVLSVALDIAFPAPPQLQVSDFMPLLIGMLGLGAMRTYERTTGVPGAVPGPQQTRR